MGWRARRAAPIGTRGARPSTSPRRRSVVLSGAGLGAPWPARRRTAPVDWCAAWWLRSSWLPHRGTLLTELQPHFMDRRKRMLKLFAIQSLALLAGDEMGSDFHVGV